MIQNYFYIILTCTLLATACNDAVRTTPEASVAPKSAEGKTIYKKHCVICHGIDGRLALNGAKDLTVSNLSDEEKIIQVTIGKGVMNAFKDILTEAEIKSVVQFTNNLKETK